MIKKIFSHFFSFNGRSGRLEFFLHGFSSFAVLILFFVVFASLSSPDDTSVAVGGMFMLLFPFILIGTMISELAITVRRLHDLDESGWNILMGLIPIYNIIQGLRLLFAEGSYGPNQFGPVPGSAPKETAQSQLESTSGSTHSSPPLLSGHKEKYKSPYLSDE